MGRAEIKESRTIMRRVEEHLRQAHLDMGAVGQSIGFVDVIYHESNPLAALNYVTPRRNTAWVSTTYIEQGLQFLQSKGRQGRVRFAEGLYPPIFVRSLHELGLQIEEDIPIMVYKAGPKPRKTPRMPDGIQITQVSDQQGMAIWWYVWRNAFYEVFASSAEPMVLGRDLNTMYSQNRIDLILYRYAFPIGVVRITLHDESAHILSLALMNEWRKPQLQKLLHEVALEYALQSQRHLVFISGQTEKERQMYREVGFIDYGSVVSYAESGIGFDNAAEANEYVPQSILVI